MRFKIIHAAGIFIAVVALLMLAGGCSGSQKLVIGIDASASPLSFKGSDGAPDGYIVELARAVGKQMGREVDFTYVNMSEGAKNFDAQKIDVLWGRVVPDSGNKKTMLFTRPYMNDSEVVLVRNDANIYGLADLDGKRLGALDGSTAYKAVLSSDISSHIKFGAPIKYSNLAMAFYDLDYYGIQAIAIDKSDAYYRMSRNAEQYKLLDEKLSGFSYAVAVRRNDSGLRDMLQSALDKLKADGTAQQISKEWFNNDVTAR